MDAERLLAMTEVSMEYAALKNNEHCPKGMYIVPSTESILSWDGVLFVHQGYYADSILKFRVRFPFTYPARAPAVTFVTDVFHPLISPDDGTLNLEPRFSPWKPKQDHVFQILHWIKVLFKKETLDNIREDDALNREAFRYRESTQSFAALATQSAMLSQTAPSLFESGSSSTRHSRSRSHNILFRETREEEIDPVRTKLGLRSWASPTSSRAES